ncbi:hypothetical protein ACFL38_02230 [Candidatus Omnitrophota bacterium]
MEKKCLAGVKVIGSIYLIVSLLAIIFPCRVICINLSQMSADDYLGELRVVTGHVLLLIPFIFSAIAGIGLLKLRSWARIGTIVIATISFYPAFTIANEMLPLGDASEKGTLIAILSLAILLILFNGFVIFFLTRPKVKEQFSPPQGGSPERSEG